MCRRLTDTVLALKIQTGRPIRSGNDGMFGNGASEIAVVLERPPSVRATFNRVRGVIHQGKHTRRDPGSELFALREF